MLSRSPLVRMQSGLQSKYKPMTLPKKQGFNWVDEGLVKDEDGRWKEVKYYELWIRGYQFRITPSMNAFWVVRLRSGDGWDVRRFSVIDHPPVLLKAKLAGWALMIDVETYHNQPEGTGILDDGIIPF